MNSSRRRAQPPSYSLYYLPLFRHESNRDEKGIILTNLDSWVFELNPKPQTSKITPFQDFGTRKQLC
ncbi:hypothetical protein Scep_013154 [Stephania cephalantha]|uniref:Uncharacterized protein n=1 Tax=Stephania cephalantha TaxID=152367 RepID=A0AAP0JGI4_9MAGN